MVYTEKYLKEKLIKELDAVHVEVTDESDGCGGKFSALIVSDRFRGKPLLARHRLVNAALQEELKSIHAFTQRTLTAEQWRAQSP
ncbi:bolA-like protein 2 [Pararge aegeria]|uniref:bolA-like protein 2 n=1 Tax=Pararge aegeria TaxID=116150 RepID=UPI0019CF8222|nr:bolA-like protein 2 [Pararge aegeria]XP_039752090.1 bolA-like protein 2 [Pararge aegeria]XP_039764412.1 bolA-like protein 2 [Pararge aegeria]